MSLLKLYRAPFLLACPLRWSFEFSPNRKLNTNLPYKVCIQLLVHNSRLLTSVYLYHMKMIGPTRRQTLIWWGHTWRLKKGTNNEGVWAYIYIASKLSLTGFISHLACRYICCMILESFIFSAIHCQVHSSKHEHTQAYEMT